MLKSCPFVIMFVRYALRTAVQLCQKYFLSIATTHQAWYFGDRRHDEKQNAYGISFMALILLLKWSGLKQNYELTNLYQTPNHRWFPPQSMQKEALTYHDKNCTQRDSMCDRYHILTCRRSVVNDKLQQHINMCNVHTNTWYYQCSYVSRMFKVTEGSIFYKTSLQHALY